MNERFPRKDIFVGLVKRAIGFLGIYFLIYQPVAVFVKRYFFGREDAFFPVSYFEWVGLIAFSLVYAFWLISRDRKRSLNPNRWY